ncbi:MAG: hypothetical protein II682_00055, partial [Firmicutes bacterium]|nr:hypothetical protein [Bacillota bacterium]
MKGLAAKLGGRLGYLGSVCVVDAKTFLPLMDVLPAIGAQLEYSKQVIVNKMDLVPESQLPEIEAAIRAVSPEAAISATTYCKVDTDAVLAAMEAQAAGPAGRETTNTYESRPVVFLLHCKAKVPYDKLETCLRQIASEAYRIKGFAATERGMISVSATGDQLELEPAPQGELENRIAVISKTGFRAMSVITAAIDNSGLKGTLCV